MFLNLFTCKQTIFIIKIEFSLKFYNKSKTLEDDNIYIYLLYDARRWLYYNRASSLCARGV